MILCVQWNTDYGLLPLCLFFCFSLALSFFLLLRFWLVLFVGSLSLSCSGEVVLFSFFSCTQVHIPHHTENYKYFNGTQPSFLFFLFRSSSLFFFCCIYNFVCLSIHLLPESSSFSFSFKFQVKCHCP